MKKLIYILLFIPLAVFNSCSNSNIHNSPNKELCDKFLIDTNNVEFQFYQEYGWTDLCWTNVILAKSDTLINFNNRFPIKEKDLALFHLNSDSVKTFSPYKVKNNSDLALDAYVFFRSKSHKINCTIGSYEEIYFKNEFGTLTHQIYLYDEINNLLYIKEYYCDE